MAKIFIDFDGVVFNTELFRKRLIKIFSQNGVPREIFEKSYRHLKKQKIPYSPIKHLRFLAKNKKIDFKKVLADLNKLMKNLRPYVFSEARIFLRRFPKNNLYLLSHGDLGFQKQKIKAAGISKYFKKIIITDADKGEKIKEITKKDRFKKGEKIIFIDDRPKHIKEAKQIADFSAGSFGEIEKILKNSSK